jgi:hypothetical protein
MTLSDQIIRVAEHLGIPLYTGATDVAAVPTDPHDLDLCTRLCNDGWRKFYNANPKGWNWVLPTFTITFDPTGLGSQCVGAAGGTMTVNVVGGSTYLACAVAVGTPGVVVITGTSFAAGTLFVPTGMVEVYGISAGQQYALLPTGAANTYYIYDNAADAIAAGTTGRMALTGCPWAYYMPDGFYGQILGKMIYDANTGHLDITQCDSQTIRSKYAVADVSGYPTLYSIEPLAGADVRRWQMLVWPKPYSPDNLTGRCRIYPNKLTQLTDMPNAGPQFDEAIMAAILAEADDQRNDRSGAMETKWKAALASAIIIDNRAAPAHLGDYGGRGLRDRSGFSPEALWNTGVDSYNSGNGTTYNS